LKAQLKAVGDPSGGKAGEDGRGGGAGGSAGAAKALKGAAAAAAEGQREPVFFCGSQDRETAETDKDAILGTDKDVNVEQVGWVQKFLYPYALDPAPLRAADFPPQGPTAGSLAGEAPPKKRAGEKFDILTTTRFNFPLSRLEPKEEYL